MRNQHLNSGVPRFSQIQEIKITRAGLRFYRVSVTMAAPLKLKHQARLCVSLTFHGRFGPGLADGSHDFVVVFPIGCTYGSTPRLISGRAGFVGGSGWPDPALLYEVPFSYFGGTLSAVFPRTLFGLFPGRWDERLYCAQVFYVPGNDHHLLADNVADFLQPFPKSMVFPWPPVHGYEAEKPTFIPEVMKAK
jgi:hypothetical protein